MRILASIFITASISFAASEPSVFGAGNLNSPNPYGLTTEEKLILENKKEIESVVQKHHQQSAKVETVAERLDGMQTILEGLIQSSNEQKMALQKLQEEKNDSNTSVNLDEIAKQVSANNENVVQMKALMEELSKLVDIINASYVTKEEFSLLLKQLKIAAPETKAEPIAKMDPKALEKKAKELFSQKKYHESKPYYEAMIQKKHKISESYFWIGEGHFHAKEYKESIYYYKESASKNEKAEYMPALLLHTGIAMEKIGDKTSARTFYHAIHAKFGNSPEAKEAKSLLEKLK